MTGDRIDHHALIARTRKRLVAEIAPLVERGAPYALLDFPDYWNIGDSAIWLGSTCLLGEIVGRPPSYVSSTSNFNYKDCRRNIGDGPIFLQGGGNFGDIYERHQTFREMIARECHGNRIIMLPQTIKYRDTQKAHLMADAIAAHPDLHLMVRDQSSVAFASSHLGCSATLVPDCAYGMGPIKRSAIAKYKLLLHLRKDVERVDRDFSALQMLASSYSSDWPKESRALRLAMRALAHGQALRSADNRRFVRFEFMAAFRLARGVALLSSAERIVTDRLHGHILSTLLGIPHVALDNDYGKVHAYIDAWDADFGGVKKALSADEAAASLADNLPWAS